METKNALHQELEQGGTALGRRVKVTLKNPKQKWQIWNNIKQEKKVAKCYKEIRKI